MRRELRSPAGLHGARLGARDGNRRTGRRRLSAGAKWLKMENPKEINRMKTIPRSGCAVLRAPALATLLLAGTSMLATPAAAEMTTRYVSARLPVNGPSVEIGAVRPAALAPAGASLTPAGHPANTWTLLATIPGAIVGDMAFVNSSVGYAAAELGQVWETTDGGNSWTEILDRGFPYYYYGIAVDGQKVVASGFNDINSQGFLTQSDDGGKTWKHDTVLSDDGWVDRVRFTHGLKDGLAIGNGSCNEYANCAWWRVEPGTWAQVTPDPDGGWFGSQFTLLKNQHAFASGIQYCTSANTGATWTCGPPADSVFDGPTEFVSDTIGWTGGGEISPNVEGWLHRTTDGGQTWSGRVLNTAWPIREILFLNAKVGWAAGGNIYSNVGGIYYSSDGGKKWSQDLSTEDEFDSCASANLGNGQTQIWCIGNADSGGSYSGKVYSTTVTTPK
jgi:photosystem II stability/assembly factor-like uncharacterized protein